MRSVRRVSMMALPAALVLGMAQYLAGCAGVAATDPDDGEPEVVVASVHIAPAPVSMVIGQTVTVGATARDAAGAVVDGRTFSWSSSNAAIATVSGAGVITGHATGSATIAAQADGVRGETAVTVSTVPVESVTLSPDPVTMAVGQVRALTPTLRDAGGAVLTGRSIAWSSSNSGIASVSSGTVTGVGAGTATIFALSEGRTGTATVTVTAPPATAVDTIFRDTFEGGSLALWQDGFDGTKQRVITDAALARSGSRLLEVSYPQGGDGGFLTRFFMPGYDSVYVSYWVRFPTTWQGSTKLIGLYGSRVDNQWSAHGRAGQRPTGTDFMVAFLVNENGGTPGNTRFYTYFPDMTRDPDGNYWGDLGIGRATYHAPLAVTLGAWHHVELWVKLNTPGQSNGVQRYWMDGVLKGEWTGLRFRDTDQIRLNSVQLTFNRSGSFSMAAQRLYVDDLRVLTARPAP